MKSRALRDMTQGSVPRHMLAFALPLLSGNFLQQFYNMVDSWAVGNFVGDGALAAVGAGASVMYLFVSLFSGVGVGATVCIAQAFGAGRREQVSTVVDTVYRAILISALPVMLLAFLGAEKLVEWMQVEMEIAPGACTYIRILGLGLVATVGYNINDGILRGLGNSRASLLCLAVATVVNVALDLLLVTLIPLGVAGVAIATVIAQLVSWICGVIYIRRTYPFLSIRPFKGEFDRTLLKKVLGIGLPAGLQMATVSLGGMAVMRKVNTFGRSYAAGYTVGLKIDNLVFLPIQALSSAATALVGQNVGAGNWERVRSAARWVVGCCLGWCALGILCIYPFRAELVGVFTPSMATIECGALFVGWVLPAYSLLSVIFSLNSVIRGAGQSLVPMLVAVIGQIFVRVPVVYLLADKFGPRYMYGGFAIGWAVGATLAVCYYASGHWKKKALAQAKNDPAV